MDGIVVERPHLDRAGMQVLDRAWCLELLGTTTTGRVGITSGALPLVLPVSFRLSGADIVFRTAPDTTLERATHDAIIAFEADQVFPTGEQWSVVVTGRSRHVTDRDERARLLADAFPAWAQSAGEVVVALSADRISGRRSVSA